MRKRLRELRTRSEQGATLVLLASLLVVLLGAAAMAADLGWLYLNGLRTQQAADAAALAGVVHMPDDFPSASKAAIDVAASNKYRDTSLGGGATVTPAPMAGSEHQLEVTVARPVDTFFMKVFGIDTVNVSRRAVAEYVLPLPMGSPEPYFGNDPQLDNWPNFWGNIHGRYTGRGMGDLYSSACLDWTTSPSCPETPTFRERGYTYGIEVPEGASNLIVELLDPAFVRGGGDPFWTGDQGQGCSGYGAAQTCDGDPGPTTIFSLYGPDPTPLDLSDNELKCQTPYAPRPPHDDDFDGDQDDANLDDLAWEFFCSVPGSLEPGIYPLNIRVATPTANERGLNRFSIRTRVAGATTRLYGLGDMAIYANFADITTFYMAEVDPIHAGKYLVIDLWDPGDARGNHSIEILHPNGSVPPCDWVSSNGSSASPASCEIVTTGQPFNNHSIKVRIALPSDYTCGADCWWKVRYNYPDGASDTTTWSARIEGNPVHLVE